MIIDITKKQKEFINSSVDEVLFGGAAGGGKSYAQLIDALLYALKYPKSKQVIFRNTFPELEKSIVRTSLSFYPQEVAKYNEAKHKWVFKNGSIIDFSYIAKETDVYNYKSAEYDVIRFDELTQFTEYMYTYMKSRLRGANKYPKSMKSSTNPGDIGHAWVKKYFIDVCPQNTVYEEKTDTGTRTRLFIPSKVQDNKFLMESDPEYIHRLESLEGNDKKALLEGCWDLEDGAYFHEFDRNIHTCTPFCIPKHWRRYVAFDYGLDMFACYFIAVDTHNKAYAYKEIYQSGLIVSEACAKLKENLISFDDNGVSYTENIYCFLAPKDLFNRHSDSGKSTAEIFSENGINLTKVNSSRVDGWRSLKEYLKVYTDVDGRTPTANLVIFNNCTNLIRTLPSVQTDKKNCNDVANEPHELTHSPDAIRYFCSYWIYSTNEIKVKDENKRLKEEMFKEQRSYW